MVECNTRIHRLICVKQKQLLDNSKKKSVGQVFALIFSIPWRPYTKVNTVNLQAWRNNQRAVNQSINQSINRCKKRRSTKHTTKLIYWSFFFL